MTDDLTSLQAEVEQLRRWKAEASSLFDGIQDLGRALGLPLGAAITGPDAVKAADELHARTAAAEAQADGYRAALALAAEAMTILRRHVAASTHHIETTRTVFEDRARDEFVKADQEARKGAHARARARAAAARAWLEARRLTTTHAATSSQEKP